DPALSPDGQQIAFTRGGEAGGLYLINGDGSNERRTFSDRQGLRSPKWSPDGRWIVFSRDDGSYKCYDVGFGGICPSGEQIKRELDVDLPRPDGCDANCEAQLTEQERLIEKEIAENVLSNFDRVEKPEWAISRISVS